jgi:glycosyltransferase involved in cell wall biosynthesis
MELLSVVVMTYNEEKNIGRCLESIQGIADEILVVDSFSQDQTIAIAQQLGARVIQRPFSNYRDQRQFSIDQAQYDFILNLDADEWLTPELRDAIAQVKTNRPVDAYFLLRKNGIGEHWLRYGGWKPEQKLRLFNRQKVFLKDKDIHEEIALREGASSAHLPSFFYHRTNTDFADRLQTVNRLSSRAAEELHAKGKKGSYARLLFKPAFRFFKEYVVQGGFRDGFYGYMVAMSSAQYVFFREAKLLEYGFDYLPRAK